MCDTGYEYHIINQLYETLLNSVLSYMYIYPYMLLLLSISIYTCTVYILDVYCWHVYLNYVYWHINRHAYLVTRYILIIYVYHLHICHVYHAYVICIMLLACILYTPTIYVCCITTTLAVPLRCASVAPSATVYTTTHATTQPVAGPAPRRDSSAIVILTPHLE